MLLTIFIFIIIFVVGVIHCMKMYYLSCRYNSFQTIYLWLDFDKSGLESVDKIARKIGLNRCLVVRPEAAVTGQVGDDVAIS